MVKRRSFTRQQRVSAVRLYLGSAMSRDEVAARYSVTPETISRWVSTYRSEVEEPDGSLIGQGQY